MFIGIPGVELQFFLFCAFLRKGAVLQQKLLVTHPQELANDMLTEKIQLRLGDDSLLK